MTGPAIEIRRASVRLGGRAIWSDIDVDVGAGQFVALLGPNGAGKSTLLSVLLGLLPAQGEVRVLGRAPGQAGSEVGYLPQRRTFGPSIRVRGVDVVRLGLDGARWGVRLPVPDRWAGNERRAAAARVEEVVDLVGAAAYAQRPIGELSGGEQQRLLIAQAIVRRPRLLLLDEPLDSLDLANQAAVAALIARVCRTEKVAVVLVAHDVNTLVGYLDRVVYLAGGRAVQGEVEQVITTETLSRLYDVPVEVLRTSDGRLVVVGAPDAVHAHAHHHH